jgi:aminoglycoside phosphotransferase family enzyme/predicted kinase
VKRAVSLGFLDFRTIEARRAACDAEVRLNARLAPGVYRGVVAIARGADGRARIGGDGDVIDWAVHMRRMPDEARADVMLERGALSEEQIDCVAERVAAFHASARCDAETSRFGTRSAIAANVEENFAQTSIDAFVRREEADEIVAWQRAFLAEHATRFDARIASKRIRDGHGDLRLEHVYFGPTPIVLDCIEFNDRFRFADVCADLAFLSMDLASHGRVDLAERFLARYARASNDFDMYALVDFYESYRAFVRAKICAMRGDAPGARRHLLLALSADRRSLLAPAVVAVGGIIASGKSTIAERLGDAMGAPVVEADRTRKAMLGVAPTERIAESAWHGAYDPAFTDRVYAEVLRRAGVVLAAGRPVVLDASFRSKSMRAAARALAQSHGVPFHFVECRADAATCRSRLAARAKSSAISDGRIEIFDDFVAKFEPPDEIADVERTVLDTTHPPAESLATLRARLDTWPVGLNA